MRILITRPRADAAPLADKLTALGHEVLVEPLLDIRIADGVEVDLQGVQALLFTSANGVRAFAANESRRDLPAFCVGDSTAQEARSAGFEKVESASGNVEDLARLVRERLNPQDGALLHAAGSVLAGDLAAELTAAGFQVHRTVLYEAEPSQALSQETIAALIEGGVQLALFFSPRTAETFARLIEKVGIAPALSQTVALGLSEAAVAPIRGLPWAKVEAARRPDVEDILRAIPRQTIIDHVEGNPPPPEPPDAPAITFGRRADDALPPPPRAAGPLGRFTMPLLVLAIVLSLGTFAVQMMQGGRSSSDLNASTVLRLETRMTGLERQLKTSPSKTEPAADLSPRLEELSQRIAGLEQKLGELQGSLAAIEGVTARIDALEKSVAARPDTGQLASAMAESRRMAADLARLQEQVAALDAQDRRASHEGLALAVGQLATAAARGGHVAAEIATVRALAADDPRVSDAVGRLQPIADRDVPTIDDLGGRFSAAAAAAVRADDRARPHALAGSPVGDWWAQVMQRVSSVVTVRRVGEVAGDTLDARLARAEELVAARDLSQAIAILDGVTGPPRDALRPWVDDARARVTLDAAVGELNSAVIAATASPR